jgi:hypothetical protein
MPWDRIPFLSNVKADRDGDSWDRIPFLSNVKADRSGILSHNDLPGFCTRSQSPSTLESRVRYTDRVGCLSYNLRGASWKPTNPSKSTP